MKSVDQITEEKLKDIHFETIEWKSSLQFIGTEILFIKQLLKSNAFKPNTPNLFERLLEFKNQIVVVEEIIKDITIDITKFENLLGNSIAHDFTTYIDAYFKEYQLLNTKFNQGVKKFKEFKEEIFNYTGNILRE